MSIPASKMNDIGVVNLCSGILDRATKDLIRVARKKDYESLKWNREMKDFIKFFKNSTIFLNLDGKTICKRVLQMHGCQDIITRFNI